MAAKAQEPAKNSYIAKFTVKHDGKRYKPGSTVEMTPKQAEALLRRGTLVASEGTAVAPNPDLAPPVVGETKENPGVASQVTADPVVG